MEDIRFDYINHRLEWFSEHFQVAIYCLIIHVSKRSARIRHYVAHSDNCIVFVFRIEVDERAVFIFNPREICHVRIL